MVRRTDGRDAGRRAAHAVIGAMAIAAYLSGEAVDGGRAHGALGVGLAAALAARAAWGRLRAPVPPVSAAAGRSAAFAWAGLGASVLTGALATWGEEGRGPGSPWVSPSAGVTAHAAHAALAWAGVGWLALHLAGVARHAARHGAGVVRGMAPGGLAVAGAGAAAAAVLGAAWALEPTRREPPPLAARWASECGDCHLPYAPTLLPPEAWARSFAAEEHFGEALLLDGSTVAALAEVARAAAGTTEFSVRVAGEDPGDGRVTATRAWREAHADVAPSAFEPEPGRDERGRCDACHEGAADGVFEARETRAPVWAANAAGRS